MARPRTGRGKGGGTLSNPRGGRALVWTPELLAALEQCAVADMSVRAIEDVLGVEAGALARGALIRLQQLAGGRG